MTVRELVLDMKLDALWSMAYDIRYEDKPVSIMLKEVDSNVHGFSKEELISYFSITQPSPDDRSLRRALHESGRVIRYDCRDHEGFDGGEIWAVWVNEGREELYK
jgi:hypothetical protein